MQPLPPPPAGYQGSFHSIQNCFPYGDCYRSAEQAASGDGLAGEAHGFNPLRPNGYHGLSTPLPAPGKPPLRASFPSLCCVLCACWDGEPRERGGLHTAQVESGPDHGACSEEEHQQWGTEIPRSASGLRSIWKLQGLGRMGGTRQRGDWYPVPRPFGQLWACSSGWRDGHQGTAEHTQTCGSSACEPVCPCSHTHAPRSAHVFLLHVCVGQVCVGTCMHVRVGSARGLLAA